MRLGGSMGSSGALYLAALLKSSLIKESYFIEHSHYIGLSIPNKAVGHVNSCGSPEPSGAMKAEGPI